MNKSGFLVLAAVLTIGAVPLFSQQGTVQGKVRAADGGALPGTDVRILHTLLSATTDSQGAFLIRGVSAGVVQVGAVLRGFDEEIRTAFVSPNAVTVIDFTLGMEKISVVTEVVAERPLLSASASDKGITMTPAQIENLPSLGQRDIFRAFQLLPGVAGSNEASSGLYVRGGKPDQNLILFDGFTLYHVEHLYGYFSPFNPDAVRDARLKKGGFEAKYGGRLSSVMELTGEAGNPDEFRAGAGASFLSLDGSLGVPLWGKGSFLLAARRSFQTPLYNTLLEKFGSSSSSGPGGRSDFGGRGPNGFAQFDSQPLSYFYDLNAKLRLDLSARDRFEFSFYHGQDKLDNSREMQAPPFMTDQGIDFKASISDLTKWGNWGMSATGSRVWGRSFRSRIVLSASRYYDVRDRSMDSNVTMPVEEGRPNPFAQGGNTGQAENNELTDVGAKWENELQVSASNSLEFGLEAVRNRVSFSLKMDDASVFGFRREEGEGLNMIGLLNQDTQGLQVSAFLQDRWTLFKSLTLSPGFRLTKFDRTGTTYSEPRFDARLKLSSPLTLKAAWGVYHQFANRIIREDVMQGDRAFWSLADGLRIPVEKAIHYIAGASFETEGWLFDVEAYHKDLSGITEYALRFAPRDPGADFGQLFFQGTGTARGVEVLLQKKAGAYTGWISYTYSRVRYALPEFGVASYPASHDVPHEFKCVQSFNLKDWTFSATWIYATGRPYTPAIGLEGMEGFNGRTFYRVLTGDKNSARLPDYHRLDLAVNYKIRWGKVDPHFGLSVFNVYDQKNVWYKEFQSFTGEIIENNVNLMGLTFNLFLNLKF